MRLGLLPLVLVMGCNSQGRRGANGANPGDRPNLEVSTLSYDPRVESLGPDGFWQAALDEGMTAAVMAQTAQTSQDWQRVAAQWQQAITSLDEMPVFSDEQAQVADKIAEYQANRAISLERALAANPQCQDVNAQPGVPEGDSPLALTQVRFHWLPVDPYEFGDRPEATLVGCLTNRSTIAIDHLGAGYNYISTEWGYGVGGGDVKFLGDIIAPGQTVPIVLTITAEDSSPEINLTLSANREALTLTQTLEPLAVPAPPTVPDPQADCAAPNASETLQQLRLHRPPADDFSFVQEDSLHLVGCLTNQGSESITQGMLTFRSGPGQGHPGYASLEIAQDEVLPGQTVAFRLYGGIEGDRIYLHSFETNLGTETIDVTIGPEAEPENENS